MADVIGYVVVVGIPAAVFVAYLLGWIRYDGREPSPADWLADWVE